MEKEADVMGAKAQENTLQLKRKQNYNSHIQYNLNTVQKVSRVMQMGGGGYYYKRTSVEGVHGPWIKCGKFDSHAKANKYRDENNLKTGNGWEFKQGDKKNPPGQ